MKKLLSLLLLAAASLGTFLALGGCCRAADDDCVDGGVRRRSNCNAPKVIHSDEIAALETDFFLYDEDGNGGSGWFFSVLPEGDSFTLSAKRSGKQAAEKPVDRAFLNEVHAVILKHGLARLNGFDEVTSGLPYEYSPCSLSVDYASGERLYFQMNGRPVAEWPQALLEIFLESVGH